MDDQLRDAFKELLNVLRGQGTIDASQQRSIESWLYDDD